MDKLLTQKEACEYLNISRTTILRWEKAGKISPLRTAGKHRRYKVDDMISIITSFSARIYGKRGGKKIQETLNSLEKEDESYENNS